MHRLTGLLSGLPLAACLAAGGSAAADDAQLRGRIEQRLQADKLVDGVLVAVKGDEVTLTGVVATLEARDRAGRLALKEARAVDNRVRVWVEPRDLRELTQDVRRAILSCPRLSVFDDVKFEFGDGGVRLLGSVQQPYRKRDLERRVARVRGLAAIRNDLEVQPVSIFDDELRAQLYRRIYASGRFPNYAVQVDPPVRIVVVRGRVTLSGVVNSRVDQVLIGMLARETLAFAVDNQLVVESEQREPGPQAPPTQT